VMLSESRHATGHAVGTNPHGPEWARWLDFLHQVGTPGQPLKLVAGDYSKFDGMIDCHLMRNLIESAYETMVYHGMPDEHQNCFQSIAEDLCFPNVLVHDAVYILQRGEPSGSPGTAPLNSEINKWMLTLAFLSITRDYLPGSVLFLTFKTMYVLSFTATTLY